MFVDVFSQPHTAGPWPLVLIRLLKGRLCFYASFTGLTVRLVILTGSFFQVPSDVRATMGYPTLLASVSLDNFWLCCGPVGTTVRGRVSHCLGCHGFCPGKVSSTRVMVTWWWSEGVLHAFACSDPESGGTCI